MTNLEVKLILDRIDTVDNSAKEANRALHRKVDGVANDVNKILLWRATIVGGAIVASAIVSFITTVALAYLQKGTP